MHGLRYRKNKIHGHTTETDTEDVLDGATHTITGSVEGKG